MGVRYLLWGEPGGVASGFSGFGVSGFWRFQGFGQILGRCFRFVFKRMLSVLVFAGGERVIRPLSLWAEAK
jgi:hypothetical protein